MSKGKSGAPKGGRVHWFLHYIERIPEIIDNYRVIYDYPFHNYFIYRASVLTVFKDFFIVMRTSVRCFRVMYFNAITKDFEYKSFKKIAPLVAWVKEKAILNKEKLSPE